MPSWSWVAELPELIVLDADLNTSSKTDRFKDAYPTRFIQVGIAEQDLFGIAAGLALEGFITVPSTFAVFAARRALDQIAISICYPGLNVKIPGSYVGLPTSRAGASHNCIEDIAVMRALPNMRVADAGDNADLRAVMRTAMATPGPVYFRVTRLAVPRLFGCGPRLRVGARRGHRDGRRRDPVRHRGHDQPVRPGRRAAARRGHPGRGRPPGQHQAHRRRPHRRVRVPDRLCGDGREREHPGGLRVGA